MTQQRFGSSLPLVLSPQSIDLGEACQQPQEFLTAPTRGFQSVRNEQLHSRNKSDVEASREQYRERFPGLRSSTDYSGLTSAYV